MKRLTLLAALVVGGWSAAVPRVAVEPRGPVVATPEPAYLVWSRTDAKSDGDPTYETVLLSDAGAELGRRPGVFLANGESLYEVRIAAEKRPSLACRADLWQTPRAELPEDAFTDQVFESAEIVDVASGESRAPIASEGPELETNEQGIAIDVAERRMKIVGSIGASVSFVETSEQWPCGTMHVTSVNVHAYDAATGQPAEVGTCTDDTRALAQADFEEQATNDVTLGETTCEGVTVELDDNHRLVANHHYENYASPSYGSNGWLLTSEQKVLLPADYESDTPVVVGTYYDAHPEARGFTAVDDAVVRALFLR